MSSSVFYLSRAFLLLAEMNLADCPGFIVSTEEFVDFNFRYDVVQEAIAMMRGRDPNFELASGFFHSPAPMN